MAKRGRRPATQPEQSQPAEPGSTQSPAENAAAPAANQDALVDFAEDLGAFLGNVQSKASSWLEQRKMLADRLTQIRDTANEYLQQLGGTAADLGEAVTRGVRRGRPPGAGAGAETGTRGPGRPPKGSPAPADVVAGGRKKKDERPER